MEEFYAVVETVLRGQQGTPERKAKVEAFDEAMAHLQARFAARVIAECYQGNQPARQTGRAGFSVFVAVARASSYALADGSAYHDCHHKKQNVACALCNRALNKDGKHIHVRDKTVFMAIGDCGVGVYLCERCSKLLQLVQALHAFPTWLETMCAKTTQPKQTMQEIAGPVYSLPKSRTSDALKIPISKWKSDTQSYSETTTPFVKGVVGLRTELDYLQKFVDLKPGEAPVTKKRRTKITDDTAGGE